MDESNAIHWGLSGGQGNDQLSRGAYDNCHGDQHVWRPYVGDPVSQDYWLGQPCICGAKRITSHTCACGHTHQTISGD